MSEMPRTLLPAGGAAALGSLETIGSFFRGLIAAWFKPAAETAWLSSRSLAFDVHPIGARPNVPGAVHAFAYRYGQDWRVLYVGTEPSTRSTRRSATAPRTCWSGPSRPRPTRLG